MFLCTEPPKSLGNPDPPILVFFDSLAFRGVFFLYFPRILGVPRREKPPHVFFCQKKQGLEGQGKTPSKNRKSQKERSKENPKKQGKGGSVAKLVGIAIVIQGTCCATLIGCTRRGVVLCEGVCFCLLIIVKGCQTGGEFQTGGVSRSGLVLPFLSFLSFLVGRTPTRACNNAPFSEGF